MEKSFIKVSSISLVSFRWIRNPKGDLFNVFRKFRNGVLDADAEKVNKLKNKLIFSDFLLLSRATTLRGSIFEVLPRAYANKYGLSRKAHFSPFFLRRATTLKGSTSEVLTRVYANRYGPSRKAQFSTFFSVFPSALNYSFLFSFIIFSLLSSTIGKHELDIHQSSAHLLIF